MPGARVLLECSRMHVGKGLGGSLRVHIESFGLRWYGIKGRDGDGGG